MNATENPPNATRRFRMPRTSMILATAVATIATYSAYLAMVKFGVNVLGMDHPTSMITSGVFELLLFTVAILAREAAQDGRPHGVLLFLTWLLSSTSGFFAAWDEIYLGHPWAAAVFRFCIPIAAALGWHLALIGYRHLSSGVSWGGARRLMRMQRFYEAVEAALRAADTGSIRKINRAQRRLIRARSKARRVVAPADMSAHTSAWSQSDTAIVAMVSGARHGHNELVSSLLGTNATIPAIDPNATQQTATDPNATPSTNATHDDQPTNGNGTGPNATIATVSDLRPVNATQATDTAAATLNTTDEQTNATPAPVPAPKPAHRTPNATVRRCKGCGKELPANATARAQYCVTFKPDGSRDQKCKNDFNARKLRDTAESLERVMAPGRPTAFA